MTRPYHKIASYAGFSEQNKAILGIPFARTSYPRPERATLVFFFDRFGSFSMLHSR